MVPLNVENAILGILTQKEMSWKYTQIQRWRIKKKP